MEEVIKGLILAKVEGSGLSAHMKEMVWREVEKEGVRVGDVEETTYNTIASSGIFTCMNIAINEPQLPINVLSLVLHSYLVGGLIPYCRKGGLHTLIHCRRGWGCSNFFVSLCLNHW